MQLFSLIKIPGPGIKKNHTQPTSNRPIALAGSNFLLIKEIKKHLEKRTQYGLKNL